MDGWWCGIQYEEKLNVLINMPPIPLGEDLPTTASSRWSYKQGNFECNLRCMRCMARVGNRQCSRKSCYTIPYCWQHLKLVAHLRLGRTTLKDRSTGVRHTFRGLFACDRSNPNGIVFRRGDLIVTYLGEILSIPETDARYGGRTALAPYGERTDVGVREEPDVIVDGACLRGVGNLANDALPGSTCTATRCRTNAELVSGDGNYPRMVALRNIRDGDEIFVSYGERYWRGRMPVFETRPKVAYNKIEHKC